MRGRHTVLTTFPDLFIIVTVSMRGMMTVSEGNSGFRRPASRVYGINGVFCFCKSAVRDILQGSTQQKQDKAGTKVFVIMPTIAQSSR